MRIVIMSEHSVSSLLRNHRVFTASIDASPKFTSTTGHHDCLLLVLSFVNLAVSTPLAVFSTLMALAFHFGGNFFDVFTTPLVLTTLIICAPLAFIGVVVELTAVVLSSRLEPEQRSPSVVSCACLLFSLLTIFALSSIWASLSAEPNAIYGSCHL